jgi:hypothetical protein
MKRSARQRAGWKVIISGKKREEFLQEGETNSSRSSGKIVFGGGEALFIGGYHVRQNLEP